MAEAIRLVMCEAYRVEAARLGVQDFAPLHRTTADIIESDALFLGISLASVLAAVAEIEHPAPAHVHIGSLVVLPSHFRRGLATALIRHIIATHLPDNITVSTGALNAPALQLYTAHAFREHQRFTTHDGIPMITLLWTAG